MLLVVDRSFLQGSLFEIMESLIDAEKGWVINRKDRNARLVK